MSALFDFILENRVWVYRGLGLLAIGCLGLILQAYQRLQRTPFGLEREGAIRQRNVAMVGLLFLAALAGSMYFSTQLIFPNLSVLFQSDPTPTPMPTATPIVGNQPLVVDSSGCNNPLATLTKPITNDRIAGSFEVLGTANISDFAYYEIQISGANTHGEWTTVDVGNAPVIDTTLGSFDSSIQASGTYAFRLIVYNARGEAPPPCVVVVTIANLTNP